MKTTIILKEGITGKMHVANKRQTNNNVKAENTSISFCIKQALKHDAGFFSSIAGFNQSDVNPANLLPLLQGKEGQSGKFTAWLVLTLVKRFYTLKAEKSQPIEAKSTKVVTSKVAVKGETKKVKKAEKVTA